MHKSSSYSRAAILLLLLHQLCFTFSSAASAHPTAAAARWAAEAAAAHAVSQRLSSSDDVVFSSGTIPSDTEGKPVFAHEGCMLTTEDSYLWYGSGQKRNITDGTHWDWLSDSIILYTSHDLSSWKKRATVFTADAVPAAVRQRLTGGSNGLLRLVRPKVLYNTARRYYVLMVSLGTLDRSKAEVGWAVSVSPYGPFKFDSSRQPDGLPSYDMTVASVDDTDAWMARTVPDFGIMISKLNADFLETTGHCATIPPPNALAASTQEQFSASELTHDSSRLRQRLLSSALQQAASDGSVAVEGGRMAARSAAPQVTAVAAASLRSGIHDASTALQVAPSIQQQQQQPQPQPQPPAEAANGGKTFDPGAPCLFKYKGKWYLLAAKKMGWAPGKVVLYVNDGSSPCDEASWRQLPPPAQGPGARHTFDSTPAFVYAHQFAGSDQVLLVYFGDRWHPSEPQGPSNASYVWLPLVAAKDGAQPDALQLLNLNSWRLGDFRPPASVQES